VTNLHVFGGSGWPPAARAWLDAMHPFAIAHDGQMYEWSQCYRPISKGDLETSAQRWMERCLVRRGRNGVLRPFPVNNGNVRNLITTGKWDRHRQIETEPQWLERLPGDPDASGLIQCLTVVYDSASGKTFPATPRLFTRPGLTYDPPTSNPGTGWLKRKGVARG
jgi:hypothetical protein